MNILTLFGEFSKELTKPTFDNLCVLLRGAILSHGPRTTTECLRNAWPWVTRHFSSYENVLRRSVMNERRMARIVFEMVLKLVTKNSVVELVVDETVIRRYGPYVYGVSVHRDGVRSSKSNCRMTPGNMWVVLAVAVKLPFLENVVALPILSTLYISPKPGICKRTGVGNRKHRTQSQLAKLMMLTVFRWAPDRYFRLVGDAWYATHIMADFLNDKNGKYSKGTLVSRFKFNARLHEEPGEYSGFGRPRIIGERLPNPRQMMSAENANWVTVSVAWYRDKQRSFMLLSGTGLWYRCSQGATWVRWVVVRDPNGKRADEIFFTTDRTLSPAGIVECYVRRWSIEVTFEEVRRHLGIETLRNRSQNAVRRSVPMLFALYSLIVTWFALFKSGNGVYINRTPWYKKKHITFSDMMKVARFDILNELVSLQDDKPSTEFQVASLTMNIIYSLIAEKRKSA